MQIDLSLFLKLIREYTTLYKETGFYPSKIFVEDSIFVYKSNWMIPAGTHLKFDPGKDGTIPDYISNSSLAAMSVSYENIQRFAGYKSLDVIPGPKVLAMIFNNIFLS